MHNNLATSSHIFSTLSDRNHPSTDQTPNPFYCCFWSRSGNWKGFPVYTTESYKVVVCSGTSKTPILLSLPDPAVRHCPLIGLNQAISAAKPYCRIVGFEVLSQPRSQSGTPKLSGNIPVTWPCNAVSVNNTGNSAHKLDLFGNHKTDTTLWS